MARCAWQKIKLGDVVRLTGTLYRGREREIPVTITLNDPPAYIAGTGAKVGFVHPIVGRPYWVYVYGTNDWSVTKVGENAAAVFAS